MAAAQIHSAGPLAAGRGDLFLPVIRLERASNTPLYEQIRAQLVTAIRRDGRPGSRLPSTRLLSRMLGVSRNTVVTAYEELAAEGLLEGRTGSGMMITTRPAGPVSAFDPIRALRAAQYPSRTLAFADPDGTWLYLTYY